MKKGATLLLVLLSLLISFKCSDESSAADLVSSNDTTTSKEQNTMKITVGTTVFTATLVDNSSTKALKAMLAEGPVTVNMRDYGSMEKVGTLPKSLPRNDEHITTEAGDLILYQGNAFVIYYAPNSWNFTRLGKIENVTAGSLKEALGNGDIAVVLSLD